MERCRGSGRLRCTVPYSSTGARSVWGAEEGGRPLGGDREKVRELVDALVEWRAAMVEVKNHLSVHARLRSSLECVLADRIQPAIEDLTAALKREPGR